MKESDQDKNTVNNSPRPRLWIEAVRESAQLPFYVHTGDAGMDVCAAETLELAPGETRLVPTGLILHIPAGYEIQVRPRSGLSLKTRLRLANSPGTVDSGFKDELQIIVHNCSPADEVNGEILLCGEKANRAGRYRICAGDRIAQLVMAAFEHAEIVAGRPDSAAEDQVQNRGGGFGHSGI